MKATVRIKDLFEAFSYYENREIPINTPYFNREKIFIESGENCLVPITSLMKKHASTLELVFDNTTLQCATKHILLQDNKCVYASDLKIGDYIDTKNGPIQVKDIKPLKLIDEVFDFMIDSKEHLYTTTNNIIHHNTSLAMVMLKEKNVDDGDILYINSPEERKIDDFHNKITNFAKTYSIGDMKYVILDECLDENEEIKTINSYIKLKDMKLNKDYSILSFNLNTKNIEEDVATIVSSKVSEIYEVELEDGRKIKTTLNHPFLIERDNEIIQCNLENLRINDYIVTV